MSRKPIKLLKMLAWAVRMVRGRLNQEIAT